MWCPRPDSNRHAAVASDFESDKSTISSLGHRKMHLEGCSPSFRSITGKRSLMAEHLVSLITYLFQHPTQGRMSLLANILPKRFWLTHNPHGFHLGFQSVKTQAKRVDKTPKKLWSNWGYCSCMPLIAAFYLIITHLYLPYGTRTRTRGSRGAPLYH